MPASIGKRLRMDWQKAWSVKICNPPDVSTTLAKSLGAALNCSGVGACPNYWESSSSIFSVFRMLHSLSFSFRRMAISLAAAFVNVRARIL